MSARRHRVALVAVTLAGMLTLAGCGGPAINDRTFTFNNPGAETRALYDPPQARGAVPAIGGEDVMAPGTRVGTEQFAGQVVVLNVWGSWCGPCRGEAPELDRVARATAPLGVQFLGINVRDDRQAAADFHRDRAVPYPSIFDPPGRSLLALRGFPRNVVPSTIVLDREQRVAAVFLTAVLASDIEPTIRRVAAEPRPTPGGAGP